MKNVKAVGFDNIVSEYFKGDNSHIVVKKI